MADTRKSVKIAEKALRAALSSRSGTKTGKILVEKVGEGEPVVINLEDNTKLVITTTVEAIETLIERFEWCGEINWTDDQTAAYVLGVCQRLADRFTIADVLRRLVVERPSLALEFPSAWGRLVKHKFIRRVRSTRPHYELTPSHEWPLT
jgi:hypothetical protein